MRKCAGPFTRWTRTFGLKQVMGQTPQGLDFNVIAHIHLFHRFKLKSNIRSLKTHCVLRNTKSIFLKFMTNINVDTKETMKIWHTSARHTYSCLVNSRLKQVSYWRIKLWDTSEILNIIEPIVATLTYLTYTLIIPWRW